MPDSHYEYQSSLDVNQVIQGLRNIDKAVDRTAKEASQKFRQLGDAADKAGKGIGGLASTSALKIGVVGGATAAVTSKVIELGVEAARAFGQFVGSATNVASQLETTGKVFEGIFRGNEEAATAALARIRKESRLLGVDLSETAASFLPFVKSLDELSRVGRISAALTIAQPEQGAVGARIALQEALSGNVQSLVRRFEVPKEFAKQLQDALDTGGVTAFLDEFERVLQVMGRDLDNLGDTFQASVGKVTLQGDRLRAAFGQPIVETLKGSLNDLSAILEERGPELELIASAFGDIVANVAEFVTSGLTDFLANLDTEEALGVAQAFFNLLETAQTFVSVISELAFPDDFLGSLTSVVEKLEAALITATQLSSLAAAESARAQAEADAAAKILGAGRIVPGMRQGIIGTLSEGDQAKVEAAGQQAFNDVILKTNQLLEESTKKKEENLEVTRRRREEQEKSTKAGETEADAFLAEQQRLRELNELLEAGAAARQKIDEETEKAELDHQRKMDDIQLKAEQDRLDQIEENAAKRLELARKNLQEIEDIERKNDQEIADAATDLTREEQDIARKAARERIQIEKEEAKDKVKVQEDFQKEIASIKKKFNQVAEEAERERDAIAFLEAVRVKNQEVEQAKETRTEKVNEAKAEAEEKRATLAEQLEFELEDARITNERKLEDLQTNLERQLEAQQINYERQLEAQTIAEATQEEKFNESLQRQIDAANLANQRKLEDLKTSLAAEIEAVKKAEETKTKIVEEEIKQRAKIAATIAAGSGIGSDGAGPQPVGGDRPLKFHDGGVVPGNIGQPVAATLLGGEVVTNPYRTPAASPVPLPLQSIQNFSRVDNSLRVDSLNVGGGGDAMDRFVTYNELVTHLARLRSRGAGR